MATEKKKQSGILAEVAKAVGSAAGTVASMTGLAAPAVQPAAARKKIGKLVKKNKARLPRREKKALQKSTAKKATS